MSREVVLYIAVSIDGYIADIDGQVNFLESNNDAESVEEDNSYQVLMEKIDTVVMGRTTYEQVINELSPDYYPYDNQISYIITSRPKENIDQRIFTKQDPVTVINELKETRGKAIWIVGGGSVITPLVAKNMIDTYIIATVPILLGKGIPLFKEFDAQVQLTTTQTYVKNGLVYTTYTKT